MGAVLISVWNSDLFLGKNSNKQSVFSWVATDMITEFHGDILALLNTIVLDFSNANGFDVDFPTFTDSLGYVGFGTQAFNSEGTVTFFVPSLSIDVRPFGG